MTDYQKVIYKLNYARWNGERREEWAETVDRYIDFFKDRVPIDLSREREGILSLDVVPSMRVLWSAGKALEESNIAAFNCAYVVFENPKDFADHLFILMHGTGSGFSVEYEIINNLPPVAPHVRYVDETIVVRDSKLGWAEATQRYFEMLFDGKIPKVDYSLIRPKGAILKTFGGRASGAEPLIELFEFSERLFINAAGRKLTTVEVNDIACYIANIVVSGGVRRSACISLSDLDDEAMAKSKSGKFWENHPYRAMANNSAVYLEKPPIEVFKKEWQSLVESGSGERGMINRFGIVEKMKRFGREIVGFEGVNPCGEILLKPRQFCNLSEVIIRPSDSLYDLKQKVKMAVTLGLIQSTLNHFPFIDKRWVENTYKETIIGVSLTGLRDHFLLQKVSTDAVAWLQILNKTAHIEAERVSRELGIAIPKMVTAVKPSGTVSQLVGCSSGLHAAYSHYYIRRIRVAFTDPMAKLLLKSGVPYHPEVGQNLLSASTFVFEFPIKAAPTAVVAGDLTGIEQLEYWKMIVENWADHNASCTIYVKNHEWEEVGNWVYENFDSVIGLSFLPVDNHVYELAPYQKITESQYKALVADFPKIDFSLLTELEAGDYTTGAKTLACMGGSCEI